ncbi:hypothetical protein H6G51_07055 [Limnothrix sp. FACHB-708]|uniref:hypothetical protein n=1 Tax=unclassified Limnothrix TaxID=2632864 RepID=UPI0016840CC4|nr:MULTISPECIES: hypothetical protein [unclassified Limnothrix]MBD2553032.1 hypothetical protein [Limnothrix sp. FACHB-708]MBD2589157.1 hypothetical protein [Limnothrix sp. FACHB-406]
MQSTLLLLVLWDLERMTGAGVPRKGKVSGKGKDDTARSRCGSKVKVSDFEEAVDALLQAGAVSENGGRLSLTAAGKARLDQELRAGKLTFWTKGQKGTVVSAKNAQAALNWLQQAPAPAAGAVSAGEKITSYDEFKTVVLDTHKFLNEEHRCENFVPIYQIRRQLGDRISRTQFDEWLLEMQGDDIFQLEKGNASDASKDQLKDSIETKTSGLRFYAKLL